MSKREKTLALIVLMAILAGLGNYAVKSYRDWISDLDNQILSLTQDERQYSYDKRAALANREQFNAVTARSLPSNASAAQTQYKSWLLLLLQGDLKLQDVKITSDPVRTIDNTYDKHTFQISCNGSLQQLTEFLYRFYATRSVHRVLDLAIQPKGYNFLGITARIEAIAISDPTDRLPISEIESMDQLAYGGLDEYMTLMTNRNLFGPENNEPSLPGSSRITATVGQSKSVTLSRNPGNNEQQVQTVRFSIVDADDIPPGFVARIDDNQLIVRGNSVGRYTFEVDVSDTGLPVRTVRKEFTVDVEERPEPVVRPDRPAPPVFDLAQLAYFTGSVQINSRLEVWILRRDTSKMLKLTIGDPISIGTVTGQVTDITQKELIITTDSDETLLVKAGNSLASAENLTEAAEELLQQTPSE